MKKILSIVLLCGMLLTFAGCGSKPDPNCGVYEARSASIDGITISVKQVYKEDFWIELKDAGKATLHLEGNDYNLVWKIEGNNIRLTASDTEFFGTVSEGVMVLRDFSDSDMDFTLVCEELLAKSDYSKYWNGRWYGWRVTYSGWGAYAGETDLVYDVTADIIVNGKTGTINIWDFEGSEDELLFHADFRLEEGATKYGKMVVQEGSVFGMDLNDGDLEVDPGVSTVTSLDHMIEIRGIYLDPENEENGLEYIMYLRPWGMTWDDVEKAESEDFLYADMMPGCYDEYLVAIGVLDEIPEEDDEEEIDGDVIYDPGFFLDDFGDTVFDEDEGMEEKEEEMIEEESADEENP